MHQNPSRKLFHGKLCFPSPPCEPEYTSKMKNQFGTYLVTGASTAVRPSDEAGLRASRQGGSFYQQAVLMMMIRYNTANNSEK